MPGIRTHHPRRMFPLPGALLSSYKCGKGKRRLISTYVSCAHSLPSFLACHLIGSPGFGPGAGVALCAAWGGEQLAGEEPFLGKQRDPWGEVRKKV